MNFLNADVDAELLTLFREIFAKAQHGSPTEPNGLDRTLWSTLQETGLSRLTGSEAAGGSAGTVADGAAMLHAAGYSAARVPVGEHDLLAGWLAETADVTISGLATAASTDSHRSAVIPWARFADTAMVLASTPGSHELMVFDTSGCDITAGANLAGEPRDAVSLPAVPVHAVTVGPEVADEFWFRTALLKSALIAGGLARVLDMCIEHVTTRVQFGKPIAALQAVQHLVVDIAAQVRLTEAAVEHAARQVANGWSAQPARFAVATARSVAGHAATVAVRNGHQVHGAIGTTTEHRLHEFTTRLLAWRGEGGSTAEWDGKVDDLVSAGVGVRLWDLITEGG